MFTFVSQKFIMKLKHIISLFSKYKETHLYHRYITNTHLEPLLEKLKNNIHVEIIGKSVLNKFIYGFKMGTGEKRIFMWSQMHGNESTTTKAIFDLLNSLLDKNSNLDYILKACTLYIIPILNPDGAEAYTRVNANEVDLNRDAQDLSQPESQVLRKTFEGFKPHFCYNLHGQRTIFSAGHTNKVATVSFLSPAQDSACTITPNRKVAMEVISVMNTILQEAIPNQIGVYDDAFNLNCVGDTFQSENVPTILFEAGHYENDYPREQTRKFIYIALLESLDYISKHDVSGDHYESYLKIPENGKLFYDIIIRNAKVKIGDEEKVNDIGILYQERLIGSAIHFVPKVKKIDNLKGFYGHREINAEGLDVLSHLKQPLQINYENDFVMINNEKISLVLK